MTASVATTARTGQRTRLLEAIRFGVLAGLVAYASITISQIADFRAFHFAAQTWVGGGDPYTTPWMVPSGGRMRPEPFYYPPFAVWLLAPLAFLPAPLAGAIFVAFSAGLLSWAVRKHRQALEPLLFSGPFLMAVLMGQWSILLTAAFLLPAFAWLYVVKPSMGAGLWLARPTWRAAAMGAALILASLLADHDWPSRWLANLAALPRHRPPILEPGGVLLLLALLRWRLPEARLLVALSCVPQLLYFYDQLPLMLVARTARESMLLSVLSLLGLTAVWALTPDGVRPAFRAAPWVLATIHLPCLVIVLRRRNELPVQPATALLGRLRDWLATRRSPGDDPSGT
jgi:hypothetical protein